MTRDPLRELRQLANSQGWRITTRLSGHEIWYPPDPRVAGIVVPAHNVGRKWRTYDNVVTRLRRAGLAVRRK